MKLILVFAWVLLIITMWFMFSEMRVSWLLTCVVAECVAVIGYGSYIMMHDILDYVKREKKGKG
jgi:hypothetical protein